MSSRKRLAFPVTIQDGTQVTIQISDPSDFTADNLALATWGSSEVLANALHKLERPNLSGTGVQSDIYSVLELGAGTGLVGLTAAAVWGTHAGLTDLEPILPNLKANIELNKDLIAQYGGSAWCSLLDWSQPSLPIVEHKPYPLPARVIVAADTVYSEEHPELLTKVVVARLERCDKARLIMCYPLRVGYLDHIRDLWERLEAAGLESIGEGRESLGKEWEEDTPYEWCIWRWRSEQVKQDGDVHR